jgi:hypothetical protein
MVQGASLPSEEGNKDEVQEHIEHCLMFKLTDGSTGIKGRG